MSTPAPDALLPTLQKTVNVLAGHFDQIPPERKAVIRQLARFIESRISSGQPALLNFICTHNSRRSHIAQIWAQAAALYYGLDNVRTYSGGTEATAFNSAAVTAMQAAGFGISMKSQGPNPIYEVRFSTAAPTLSVFSKAYDHPSNPGKDFAAIMTCSHADQNCPIIAGSAARIALPYDDPKDFDNTPQAPAKYMERVHQIGREILFACSIVSKQKF